MTNVQRMKNDIATTDRRDLTDKAISDNRDRNDEITADRRYKADRTLEENRLRNDKITSNRRDQKDSEPSTAKAVILLTLIILTIGAIFVFI